MSHVQRITLGSSVAVEVDGSTVPDPENGVPAQLAVTVRMPGFVAHALSHVLGDYHRVCDVLDARHAHLLDGQAWAGALHEAAEAARTSETAVCRAFHQAPAAVAAQSR